MRAPFPIILLATALAALLAGCAPPEAFAPEAMAEPVLEAPIVIEEAAPARTQTPVCPEDDDGIGGTGCTPVH